MQSRVSDFCPLALSSAYSFLRILLPAVCANATLHSIARGTISFWIETLRDNAFRPVWPFT